MQNVLVTGGAGFIGSNFIHDLLRGANFVQAVERHQGRMIGCPEEAVCSMWVSSTGNSFVIRLSK